MGFLVLARRRKRHEAALALDIAALGARGEPRRVTERLRQLSKP